MVNDIIKSLQGDLDKGIEAFKRELAKVRTGRANLAILDGVRVDYYGTQTPLNQVASVSVTRPPSSTASSRHAATGRWKGSGRKSLRPPVRARRPATTRWSCSA